MAQIDIKDDISHMDPTPTLRELAHALKKGKITVVPNIHAQTGYPLVWVSLTDLAKIKASLGEKKKEKSGAV